MPTCGGNKDKPILCRTAGRVDWHEQCRRFYQMLHGPKPSWRSAVLQGTSNGNSCRKHDAPPWRLLHRKRYCLEMPHRCLHRRSRFCVRHRGVVKQTHEWVPEAEWTHRFFSCTGKVLQQSRCQQNCTRPWTWLRKLLLLISRKKNALDSRCLAAPCERLDADHLYHSEIRRLSGGDVLNCLLHWEKKCTLFWKRSVVPPEPELYTGGQFCAKLAYLSDQLNQLNVSMQGRNGWVFLVSDKIEGLERKKPHILGNRRVKEGRYDIKGRARSR